MAKGANGSAHVKAEGTGDEGGGGEVGKGVEEPIGE
jgi:hypothetical protein